MVSSLSPCRSNSSRVLAASSLVRLAVYRQAISVFAVGKLEMVSVHTKIRYIGFVGDRFPMCVLHIFALTS